MKTIMTPYNMLAVLLLAVATYSAVIPDKEVTRNEEWAEDYNLVEPPPAVMLLSHIFDHSKSKITPQSRLKSVIKAMYQYDTMKNLRRINENKEVEDIASPEIDLKVEDGHLSPALPEEEKAYVEEVKSEEFLNSGLSQKEEKLGEIRFELKEVIPSSSEQSIAQESTTESDVDPTEQTEQTTQKIGVLLEDLVDSIIHVPAHMEGDKAQKFTHSIRYGYGVPFHFNGL